MSKNFIISQMNNVENNYKLNYKLKKISFLLPIIAINKIMLQL